MATWEVVPCLGQGEMVGEWFVEDNERPLARFARRRAPEGEYFLCEIYPASGVRKEIGRADSPEEARRIITEYLQSESLDKQAFKTEVVCPWCGYVDKDLTGWHLETYAAAKFSCEKCGRRFRIHVIFCYATTRYLDGDVTEE